MRTTGQSAPTRQGTRDFVDPFCFTPLFSLSYPIFSCPLVGIWWKGLYLLLAENSNFGSGRAEFQSSLLWRPGEKSRNVWVFAGGRRPPPSLFFLFLSPTLRPHVFSHSSLNLASFALFQDPKYFHLLYLSILGPQLLGLCKRFSERLCSLLPINCAFCSWGDN